LSWVEVFVYLIAQFLLEKGYSSDGIKRRASSFNTARIDHLYRDPHTQVVRLFLDHGDLADSSKAKEKLGWTPKITFKKLVAEMVREDLKSAERDELLKLHGYQSLDYNE
jgi:GDP-D-mannose dehydratase